MVVKEKEGMLSIDFMVELSKSFKYNMIITVIDLVSKQAYFILTHTICYDLGLRDKIKAYFYIE